MSRKQYKLILLRKAGETAYVEKILNLKTLNSLEKGGPEKKYLISPNFPAFIDGRTWVYFVDFDSGAAYTFHEVKMHMSPDELDSIVSGKIIRELTKGVMDNRKEKIGWIVIGFVIGALLGALGVLFWAQNEIAAALTSNLPPFGVIT